MPRITASVTDAQKEHVEELSDEIDDSEAEVVRRLIELHRVGLVKTDALMKEDVHHNVLQDVMHGMSDAPERIRELEDRVDELEEIVSELSEALEENENGGEGGERGGEDGDEDGA